MEATEATRATAGSPSSAFSIAKADLNAWVTGLLEAREVIAPTAAEDGDVLFMPIESPAQVLWEFRNPLAPPKAFLLPQVDPLLQIRTQGHGFALDPLDDARPRILLNVRSCDARGFALLRAVFAAEPADGAYLRRADATSLVTLACHEPCAEGFCVCCDAGPFLRDGFDLQLTDLGDRLLAEPGGPQGRRLLAEAGPLFTPAAAGDLARRLEREAEARRRFGPATCHFASAMRRVSTGRVAEALWQAMGDWCLECGACNFLCPACYCFSVADQGCEGGFTRCRLWDSCQYPAFTLEASGHNPRARRGERIKRRIFHKTSAQYFQRDGAVGCVGCGRCVRACLGTTDLPALLAAVRRGAWHG
jgi:ferredoxin